MKLMKHENNIKLTVEREAERVDMHCDSPALSRIRENSSPCIWPHKGDGTVKAVQVTSNSCHLIKYKLRNSDIKGLPCNAALITCF